MRQGEIVRDLSQEAAAPTDDGRRRTRNQWAFLIPSVVLACAGASGEVDGSHGNRLFVVLTLTVLAGAAWQSLHRRDLVARLTRLVGVVLTASAALFIGAWRDEVRSSLDVSVGAFGVLAGCVLAENWLRLRDDRPRPSARKPRTAPRSREAG